MTAYQNPWILTRKNVCAVCMVLFWLSNFRTNFHHRQVFECHANLLPTNWCQNRTHFCLFLICVSGMSGILIGEKMCPKFYYYSKLFCFLKGQTSFTAQHFVCSCDWLKCEFWMVKKNMFSECSENKKKMNHPNISAASLTLKKSVEVSSTVTWLHGFEQILKWINKKKVKKQDWSQN